MTLQATRDMLAEEAGVWCVAAAVALHDGESSHYEVSDEGHIIVSVKTLQHGVPIWAILSGGDNEKTGVWSIPSIGTEVLLNFDNGDFEGDAYIVAIHGKAPTNLSSGQVFILGDEIHMRTPGGAAVSLAKQSSLDEVISKLNSLINLYNTHVHLYNPGPGSPTPTVVTTNLETVQPPTQGTQILLGQ